MQVTGTTGKQKGDTSKDEAEFILNMGKFKTQDGEHREADPWGRGAPHSGAGSLWPCRGSRAREMGAGGREGQTGLPLDRVLTMFPTSIGRKSSWAI